MQKAIWLFYSKVFTQSIYIISSHVEMKGKAQSIRVKKSPCKDKLEDMDISPLFASAHMGP